MGLQKGNCEPQKNRYRSEIHWEIEIHIGAVGEQSQNWERQVFRKVIDIYREVREKAQGVQEISNKNSRAKEVVRKTKYFHEITTSKLLKLESDGVCMINNYECGTAPATIQQYQLNHLSYGNITHVNVLYTSNIYIYNPL